MHGEEPVEGLRNDGIVFGEEELVAHQRRFHSCDQEKEDAATDVHHPQFFVVNGGDPIVESVCPRVGACRDIADSRLVDCRHGSRFSLLEAHEIVDDLVEGLSLDLHCGHAGSRLQVLGVKNPGVEVGLIDFCDTSTQSVAAHQVGKVGAKLASGYRSSDRVAIDACGREEDVTTLSDRRDLGCVPLLSLDPTLKFFWGMDVDP